MAAILDADWSTWYNKAMTMDVPDALRYMRDKIDAKIAE